jgi:hypothetical protein
MQDKKPGMKPDTHCGSRVVVYKSQGASAGKTWSYEHLRERSGEAKVGAGPGDTKRTG